jgi:hypothetical protein
MNPSSSENKSPYSVGTSSASAQLSISVTCREMGRAPRSGLRDGR